MPWVCYRRRNQWLRLALAFFCLPLTWLARVVHLLVGVAEGWGGRRGHACPCAVLGHSMLRHSVGVGVGVMRISRRRFVALLARRVFHAMFQFLLFFACRRSVQFSSASAVQHLCTWVRNSCHGYA